MGDPWSIVPCKECVKCLACMTHMFLCKYAHIRVSEPDHRADHKEMYWDLQNMTTLPDVHTAIFLKPLHYMVRKVFHILVYMDGRREVEQDTVRCRWLPQQKWSKEELYGGHIQEECWTRAPGNEDNLWENDRSWCIDDRM